MGWMATWYLSYRKQATTAYQAERGGFFVCNDHYAFDK